MKSLCKLQILRDILLNIYYQYRFEGQKFTGSYRRVYLWLIASVIQLYLIIHLTPEVNIFLGLLNCPYLVSFALSWAAHLIQSWSISAFLVFLLPFCDPVIPPLILFFSQPLLFNSSVPSYILSNSFSLLSLPLFFFFFFPQWYQEDFSEIHSASAFYRSVPASPAAVATCEVSALSKKQMSALITIMLTSSTL